jgi:hypothetical protein
MNLQKIFWRHQFLFLLAILFEIRAIWVYFLSPDTRLLLVYSSIALAFLIIPYPLEASSVWLEGVVERKKIAGSLLVFLLAGILVVGFWMGHSRIWAVLDAIFGAILLLAIWKDRIFPDDEKRREKRRARVANLFADRDAFEKDWERSVKIGEGIVLLLCASLAVLCWITFSKALAILPALLGLMFLVGLFAQLTPLSDEKFEMELAEAKTRYARTEARRAEFAARRARRAERREERKNGQRPSRPSADNFFAFFYWCVLLCVFGFQDRSRLEKPDLVFCALPAWYLMRAFYFWIQEHNRPKGPDAPLVSDSSAAGQ